MGRRVEAVLKAIERYQAENKIPPSLRDPCQLTEITSTSVVVYYFKRLV